MMGRRKLKKPRRVPMKIVDLTKETVPEILAATDTRKEEELLALISLREEQGKEPYQVRIPRKPVI